MFSFSLVNAQDTTALRFIAITAWDSEDIIFFQEDTTDLYGVVSDIHGADFTGHALFVNPNDGLLYAVVDSANDYATTTRALYRVNPLTGEFVVVMDLADHTASATITPEGRVFTIEGNGGTSTPGEINEIDLVNLTKTPVAYSGIPDGYSRGMIYNAADSSLYIYSSGLDSVFIMKVDDWTENQFYADFPTNYVKGGYNYNNQFWIASEEGMFFYINLADSLTGPATGSSIYSLMDATEFRLLTGPEQIQLFPGQQSILSSLYSSSSFQWYRNDTLIPGATDDTLIISLPGDYKLLAEIDASANFIWSETINVIEPAITDLLFIGIGCNNYNDVLFFNHDTTDFISVNASVNTAGGFTGHALFVNPADGLLYGIADPDNDYSTTTRKIYKVNPISGQFDLIMDLGDWSVDAAVTPDGRIFTIDGNGGTIPGAIYEIDLINLTRTQVAVSDVAYGEPRTITYNPIDSSLYIYSAEDGDPVDTVYIMEVDTWNETSATCAVDGEIHGSYYRDNQIWLSSYYGEIVYIDLANGYDGTTVVISNYYVMDITEINLLNEQMDIGVCLNEPIDVVLHAKYPSTEYIWYQDGGIIPGADLDSLVVPSYGNYRLLTEIDTSGSYIWSETINVHSLNVPSVTVSTLDSLWCPGDSILLSGSAGGTSQWYVNGTIISGANSNLYYAFSPGYYNMTKTNLNGCSDSASIGVIIVEDPGCPSTTEELTMDNSVLVYPTPFTNVINISSVDNNIETVLITDTRGAVLCEKKVNGSYATIDASPYKAGIYFLKIISTDKVIVKQIVKQ